PSSIIAINNGNGSLPAGQAGFTIQKLPVMTQLSSVNAIHCMDINNDGKTDLVLGGNQYGFLPQFERLDGSFGDVLINNGNNSFTWVNPVQSGLHVQGEVRDIIEIPGTNNNNLLFLLNDDYPALYHFNNKLKTNINSKHSK
ncbi:MAG: hypothetical protein ACRDE8_01215, partial [Ginsengibacter sp.]